jgi:hypothetical protein
VIGDYSGCHVAIAGRRLVGIKVAPTFWTT